MHIITKNFKNIIYYKYIILNIIYFICICDFYNTKKKSNNNIKVNNFKNISDTGLFEYNYRRYICSFFVLEKNKNCLSEIWNNYDFFYDVKKTKRNDFIRIDIKISLIENIYLIIAIAPFLKFNFTIEYRINNKDVNNLFEKLFYYKFYNHRKIFLNHSDFETIKRNFKHLLKYKWDFPFKDKKIFDNIRYIISNYYGQTYLDIYEKALNKNYYVYIQNNIKLFSDFALKELISK